METAGHDLSEDGDVHPLVRAGAEWGAGRMALGFEWLGAWIGGKLGDDARHHVGGYALLRPAGRGPFVRLGLGLGLATVIDVDLPPADGPPGDGLVVVGEEVTGDVLAGAGWELALGGLWTVSAAGELWAQRASDRTLRSAVLSVGARRRLGGG